MKKEKQERGDQRPRINLRPLLFCALGLIFGIALYYRIRFGGFLPSDLCFLLVFLALAAVPPRPKRLLFVALALTVFAGAGVGVAHLGTVRYLSGKPAGDYAVAGTVQSAVVRHGYTEAILTSLAFGGENTGGKLIVTLSSDEVRAGDIVYFETYVAKNGLPMSEDSYAEYLFYSDIRYDAGTVEYLKTGTSKNPFLRLNAALYDRLNEGMDKHEAEIAFALLTGNSRGMDEGLTEEVRSGGIAHIFAVSGLHIGILFGAVLLLCKPLGRKACLPAALAALLYTAFCNFTVSSVRALVMCTVLGGYRAIGRKYDFLESISLAALLIFLFAPADWLSAGARLSFGACLGLALFAGPLGRLFKKCRLPAFLANYLSANLSVQLFTLPILLETFGYFSVWGLVLNLFFIPLLPVLFLTVLLFAVLAVVIPPAAAALCVPEALLSAMLLVFSLGDFGLVLTGFSLGMGATVWVIGALLLTERVRMRALLRGIVTAALAAVFSFALVLENVVFTGARAEVFVRGSGGALLLRTSSAAVLVIDGGIRTRDLADILARRYGGTLDAVFVVAEDELEGIDHAFPLPAEHIYARDAIPTGLHGVPVVFSEEAEVDGMRFLYAARDKLAVFYEGVCVEVDFGGRQTLGADLFIDASHSLQFTMGDGIIGL